MELLVGLTVVDKNGARVVKLYESSDRAVRIPSELVPIPCSTGVCGRYDSDIFGRILRPVEPEESELCVVVVPPEIIPNGVAIVVFIYVRRSS